MNTLHFKYAVEIEKTRSITQAAENLYMAQPNLSKAIKELENTLGITIFRRTSKGVIPTDQGIKFLGYARQILMQIDNMEAIHSPDKPKNSKLRISVPRAGYISKAFSEYIAAVESDDDMEVYFCETNSLRTAENVRENGYDFGIIRYNTAHEKYYMDCTYLSKGRDIQELLSQDIIKEIKDNLTEFEFKVFSMKLDGYSFEEIANTLNKDVKSIYNTFHRIKLKIKKIIDEDDYI